MRNNQLLVAAALAACSAKQPVAEVSPEPVPSQQRPQLRPPPRHTWQDERSGTSVLVLERNHALSLWATAKVIDGVSRAVLEIRADGSTHATLTVAGTRLRLEPFKRAELPLDFPLATIALADVDDTARRIDLGVDIEVALDGYQPITTHVPPQSTSSLARAIFGSGTPTRLAGDVNDRASKRATLLVAPSSSGYSWFGSGATLGDVDLVARETAAIAGKVRCRGFAVQFERKVSEVVVYERRTGTEVARRTFEPECPRGLAYTVGGVARTYANRATIEAWLKTLVAPKKTLRG